MAKTELEKAQEQDVAAQEASIAAGAAAQSDAAVGNPLMNGLSGGTVDATKATLDNFTGDAGGVKPESALADSGFRVLHSGVDHYRKGEVIAEDAFSPEARQRLLDLKAIEAVRDSKAAA